MTARNGITVTVTERTPGGHDAYGDPITGTTTVTEIDDCGIAPRTADEADGPARHGTVTGVDLYLPPTAPEVTAGATVTIPAGSPYAGDWRVDGDLAVWDSPYTGRRAGTVAALVRAEG